MNPQFLDVDFTPDGLIPRDCEPGERFSVLEDADVPIIPRRDWPKVVGATNHHCMTSLIGRYKDQKNEGSCASNATTQAAEILMRETYGPETWFELSPISIYRWVASSPNRGSTLADNLTQLRDVGALPVTNEHNRRLLELAGIPNRTLDAVGYYQEFPDEWLVTAGHFQIVEWYDIQTVEGVVSEILRNRPVVYGREGHAITGVGVSLRGTNATIDYANSWGQWGDKDEQGRRGIGHDTEGKIASAIRGYGAWSPRAIRITDELIELTQRLNQDE